MPIVPASERIKHDPLFHRLVHVQLDLIEQAHRDGITFTPTELREAATLAAMIFEERHVRPLAVLDQSRRIL